MFGFKLVGHGIYETYKSWTFSLVNGGKIECASLSPPHWEQVFNATDDFIICPQNFGGAPYTEDCLIVNVFVPDNIQIGEDSLKSVLVIIHGGAFTNGYGNLGLPYNIVERDIVVVTLNYRLDVHGFLCLNTESIPGNMGLKDQLAALKWVKHNIQAFGGNPDDITLLGYSAGSFSAEVLMLSPAAEGLFHRVILESGSAKGTWLDLNGPEFAKIVASANGASDIENITKLEEFYLSLSYPELLALSQVPGILEAFLPCLENDKENGIVTKSPHEVLQSGNYSKLPLITGYTNGEGLFFYDIREQMMLQMNENFSRILPPNFSMYVTIDETQAVEMLRSFYFGEDVITENSIQNFTDYFSDGLFIYGIVESARLHALNSAPVYLYEFTYEASIYQTTGPSGLGSTHCTQTNLILNEGPLSPLGHLSENDLIVQRRLVDMWTNFIKNGEPIIPPEDADYWEPLNPEKMNYLEINLNIQQQNFPVSERMEIWDQIMKENNDRDSASEVKYSLSLFY
ncbi:Esterase FE4 [Eumeta japonica]|uniref:Carboxylic ester hydrolase n=1 Tax=Eumeta variegata TaxID=151549 RepID=A0A4C1SK92_EUMVA|nr:Esterase FE4 [Eumeta japonica]